MTNREPYHGLVQRLRKKARIAGLVRKYSGRYKDWKDMAPEERIRAFHELRSKKLSCAEIAAVLRATKPATISNFEWTVIKGHRVGTKRSVKKNE